MSDTVIYKRWWGMFRGMKMPVVTAVCFLFLISSCSGEGEYGTKISTEEQESEYSSVYAQVIEFSGFSNKEYQSELNMQISEGIEKSVNEFDDVARESSSLLPPGVKSIMKITQNVKRNSGGIISFIEEGYIYLGGAHGNTMWTPRTIDLRMENPHILEFNELFTDERYIGKINNLIDELIKENPEKYSELWAEPHITEDFKTQFYLNDEELVIFFPPYELSYYAKGFVEFPIRFNDLTGWIKEEYLKEEKVPYA